MSLLATSPPTSASSRTLLLRLSALESLSGPLTLSSPVSLISQLTRGTPTLPLCAEWCSELLLHCLVSPSRRHSVANYPFRQVPDDLKKAYADHFGRTPTDEVLRFCKRELFQKIWLLLLDNDFMEAYEHGFVIECADGVKRRLFPRIFTYSADYPEK